MCAGGKEKTMGEMDDIRARLWNAPEAGAAPDTETRREILEQYKICLEMADRISQRRATANTFFLTFHTAVIGALSGFYEKLDSGLLPAFFVAAILFCAAWWLLLRSYRTLNTAKFKVVGLLEERLPASPFFAAEWKALGEGKDWRRHIPFTLVEQIVPVGFALIYAYLLATPLLFGTAATG